MAQFGTHSSQMALADMASLATRSLAVRQAAAAAFSASVDRFGLRLTPSEVQRQYDRYNQSAALDKATQKVLSGLIDTIETAMKKQ